MKKLGLGMATPILLLVILLGVAVFSATSSKQSNVRTDASRKATEIVTTTAYVQETITYPSSPTQVVTGTDDIPIYPGAQEYAGGEKYGPYTGLYDFIAAASMDDVTVFYKQELAKAGWALVSETREPTFGNRYSMEFDWANPKNQIPLRRYLHISLR